VTSPRTVESTAGVQLAVHDLGGDGPPVLFAHATGFCAPIWGPVAEQLPGWHGWALDFRCHGRSTRPIDDDLDWAGTADDVLAVVDALDLHGAIGVGHSMGGAALLLAEQRRPGTFAGLWLFEPIVIPPGTFPEDGGSNPLAEGAARRRDVFPSFDAAYDNFAAKPPMSSFRPECLRAYVEGGFERQADGNVRLRCRPADESRFYLMGSRHGAYEHLGEVACPTTVVRGAPDPGPHAFAAAVAERLPRARLVDLASVSHFGPMEAPALAASSIRDAIEHPPDAARPVGDRSRFGVRPPA
jgi:pimeloyl-ACP methyl ester carboxylesterase